MFTLSQNMNFISKFSINVEINLKLFKQLLNVKTHFRQAGSFTRRKTMNVSHVKAAI